MIKVLTVGDKAYFDAFLCGIVACKITAINGHDVTIQITANKNKYYKKGEIIESNQNHVFPRSSLITRSGMYRIKNDYMFKG